MDLINVGGNNVIKNNTLILIKFNDLSFKKTKHQKKGQEVTGTHF